MATKRKVIQKTGAQVISLKTKKYIDRYVEIKRKINDLNSQLEKLKEYLLKLGEGIHDGINHTISITKFEVKVLDPKSVFNYVDKETFIRMVSINNKAASTMLTEEEFEDCVAFTREVWKINIKK